MVCSRSLRARARRPLSAAGVGSVKEKRGTGPRGVTGGSGELQTDRQEIQTMGESTNR